MRLEKKTMATLLIAVFMISAFAVAYAVPESTKLSVPAETPATGLEDKITILLPPEFKLNQLNTISWSVWTVSGYPPHVDLMLDMDDNGIYDYDDVPRGVDEMLTAEFSTQDETGNRGSWPSQVMYESLTYTLTGSDKVVDPIDNSAIFWRSKVGAGTSDAPWGTLLEWKTGAISNFPQLPEEEQAELPLDDTGGITGDTIVLGFEIEVDNWLGGAEAYVDNIQFNGVDADLLVEVLPPPIVSIMVSPTLVDFGKLRPGATAEAQVTIYNIGDVAVTITHVTTGDFFIANLVVSDPGTIDPGLSGISSLDLTVPSGTSAGIHEGKIVFEATPVPLGS